jgi:hypothetical protein
MLPEIRHCTSRAGDRERRRSNIEVMNTRWLDKKQTGRQEYGKPIRSDMVVSHTL